MRRSLIPQRCGDATIAVDSLHKLLDASLIIGNGDINAIVYSEDGSVVMNLTKNDVWDARLLTHNDPPIPTLKLIKKLGKSGAFPMKNNNSGYVLPPGVTWDKKDSYHRDAFPCPRQCARIVLSSADSAVLAGELDLGRAAATVSHNKIRVADIRALWERKRFLHPCGG